MLDTSHDSKCSSVAMLEIHVDEWRSRCKRKEHCCNWQSIFETLDWFSFDASFRQSRCESHTYNSIDLAWRRSLDSSRFSFFDSSIELQGPSSRLQNSSYRWEPCRLNNNVNTSIFRIFRDTSRRIDRFCSESTRCFSDEQRARYIDLQKNETFWRSFIYFLVFCRHVWDCAEERLVKSTKKMLRMKNVVSIETESQIHRHRRV